MGVEAFVVFLVILIGGVLAVRLRKLTVAGGITGAVIALALFFGTGLPGIVYMSAFFVMAVVATGFKQHAKLQMGAAEPNRGMRDAWQVLANAGVPCILALISLVTHAHHYLHEIMIAAAFASAAADTLSSELGTLYGSRFVDVISFKRGKRGDNGIISLEGTIIGGLAAGVIGLIHFLFKADAVAVFVITAAGILGNYADSLLGATLERKGVLGNNSVNLFNTLIAAFVGAFLYNVFN